VKIRLYECAEFQEVSVSSKRNVTRGARTVYPSGAHEFTPSF